MLSVLISVLLTLCGVARSRAALHLEVLALRHQLQVLQRTKPQRVTARSGGPLALDVAGALVARPEIGRRHREARDRSRLASAGVPVVLDLQQSPTDAERQGALAWLDRQPQPHGQQAVVQPGAIAPTVRLLINSSR